MNFMASARSERSNASLRNLPSIDELMRTTAAHSIALEAGERHTADLARNVVAGLREKVAADPSSYEAAGDLVELCERQLADAWSAERLMGTHAVINATGVVIHTNLGRAPLSEAASKAAAEEASGYCTLEYDLRNGRRGRRGERAEDLLTELTGAESVLIVNNCAAAAFFILTVFAAGGEVIISRGEMVEIGGDFRVPDVLSQSGADLREVGTTNRTKLSDYENAITGGTKVILRVHPSNYRIVGFTATPKIGELTALANKHSLLIYEDLGSGALIDLSSLGLSEPVVRDSIDAGVGLVSFSGDKLLGGPQSGIIAGKSEYIDRLRSHPIYRALRVDKITYAALEATLDAYMRDAALREVPVLRMLSAGYDEIAERAERFVDLLTGTRLSYELVDGSSAIGGGAAPAVELATKLIALTHEDMTVTKLERRLRGSDPPVIARIAEDRLMIDLRTVPDSDEAKLLDVLNQLG
jgi:L-seryl-tRNA(Ser) seleniumtransferase